MNFELNSFDTIQARLTETAGPEKMISTKLVKKPSEELLIAKEQSLVTAFKVLDHWYGVSSNSFNREKFEQDIAVVYNLFGYEPYTGSLFRSVPVKQVTGKNRVFVEDKVYRIKKISSGAMSSWTTSIPNAMTFGHDSNSDFVILELLGRGIQFINSVYLDLVVQYVIQVSSTERELYLNAKYLHTTLAEFAYEDEVIMFIPAETKVRLVSYVSHQNR